MQIVPRRDSATLFPIVQNHIHPGTIVHTDQGSMYNRLSTVPGVGAHMTVNQFVNSLTGVHTQNIESL